MGITQHVHGHNNVLAVANLALLTGNLGRPGGGVNPLRGQSNVQGACDMGCLPNVFPGYQPVADAAVRAKFESAWGVSLPAEPGLTVVEMLNAAGGERSEMRNAKCEMRNAPESGQSAIRNPQSAIRNSQFAIRNSQFAIRNSQFAIRNSQFAIRNSQFAIRNPQSAIRNSQFAIRNPQFAIRNPQSIQALYIVGENPMMTDPDTNHVRECLESLDFLVVQDIFLTETAQLADVVLPAASFAEKDGSFTNTERRVQRVRKALDPPGQARTDGDILQDLAARMGYELVRDCEAGSGMRDEKDEGGGTRDAGHRSSLIPHPSSLILEEIASLTPSYGGIRHERLEQGGLQWPCPTADHPGTPILHVGKFSRGLGRFTPVEYLPPAEEPDEEYPFLLTTGRRLEHFHGGTMTRRVEGLNVLVPEERLEMHVEDAARLGVADGDLVRVASRRGEVEVRARVGKTCRPGTVFMTFHFAEALGNVLTLAALDPVAKIPTFKVCAVRVARDG
jgi:predicted molibdopterin-dependent oxidoreductase YjgC